MSFLKDPFEVVTIKNIIFQNLSTYVYGIVRCIIQIEGLHVVSCMAPFHGSEI